MSHRHTDWFHTKVEARFSADGTKKLNGSDRGVLGALCFRANADPKKGPVGECWPGMEWIAKSAGITSRAAREAIRRLEKFGRIRCAVGGSDKPGVRETSTYTVIARTLFSEEGEEGFSGGDGRKPRKDAPPPRSEIPGTPEHPSSEPVTEPVTEPVITPTPSGQDSNRRLTKARSGVRRPRAEHFDAWWQRYPRKENRGDAEKAYAKAVANGASERDLYRGLLTCRWAEDATFIPYPANWLTAKKWLDEPTQRPDDAGPLGSNL